MHNKKEKNIKQQIILSLTHFFGFVFEKVLDPLKNNS